MPTRLQGVREARGDEGAVRAIEVLAQRVDHHFGSVYCVAWDPQGVRVTALYPYIRIPLYPYTLRPRIRIPVYPHTPYQAKP